MIHYFPPPESPNLNVDDLISRSSLCVEEGGTAALIDLPHHTNSGDAAILLGERAAFRTRGVEIEYYAHLETYRCSHLRKRVSSECVIYLHGGGSFGDLYPEVHSLRLKVLSELRDFRVVLLPQTLHFGSGEVDAETMCVVNAHPDLTLYFRDHRSHAIGVDAFGDRCKLAPDMAFSIGELIRPTTPKFPIVWLGRTDKEAVRKSAAPKADDVHVVDWPATVTHPLRPSSVPVVATHRAIKASRHIPWTMPAIGNALLPLAHVRFRSGVRLLSRGQVVVTDRLHGHILCTLLGIPHVVLENGHGKIKTFVETWTEGIPYVHAAVDATSALEIARSLVSGTASK